MTASGQLGEHAAATRSARKTWARLRLRLQETWPVAVPLVGLFVAPTFLTAITSDSNEWRVFGFTLALTIVASLVLAPSFRRAIVRWVHQAQPAPENPPVDQVFPRRTVLATFSGKSNLTEHQGRPPLLQFIVQRSAPERLVLLASDRAIGETSEVELGSVLHGWFGDRAPSLVVRRLPADEFAPAAVHAVIEEELRRGVPSGELVVDGTGGTTIMAASACLGAREANVDYQAVRQDQQRIALLPRRPSSTGGR